MSITKPKVDNPVRPVCPVCGKTAYSQGGIHPQCAVSKADKIVRETRKVADAKILATQPAKQWTKVCPRCRRQVPARRAACECGHRFLKTATG